MKICINRDGNGEACSYVKYNKKIAYLKNSSKKLQKRTFAHLKGRIVGGFFFAIVLTPQYHINVIVTGNPLKDAANVLVRFYSMDTILLTKIGYM